MKWIIFSTIGLIILIPFVNIEKSYGLDYVIDDFNFYPTPDTPRPAKGAPFQDPVFHTTITRITDGPTDLGTNYVYAGYPKHDIENANGTMLFLQSYKWPGWHLWNANPPYNYIRDLPTSIVDDIDPDVRWDATDPNILYSTYSSGFYKYDVGADQITLLHDFKADFPNKPIARVYTAEEGDASADSRYWFFMVRCYDANHDPTWWDTAYVVYDKDFYGRNNGKIISTLNEGDPLFIQGLNYTDISFDGNWVFCTEPGVIYSRDLTQQWSIGMSGHADRGISAEGRQVLFGAANRWSADGYTDMGYWTQMIDFETKQVTWLAAMGNGGGVYHIAVNTTSKPGWGLVSVYGPTYPNVPTAWDEHTIYLVELTTRTSPPARVWRIAQTHTVRKSYSDDIFGKMNKKGTKIWFGSGWGKSYGDPGAQYDVYQIDLPATWYEDLMGFSILTSSLVNGKISLAYSANLQATGGSTPYTWSIVSGALPDGVSLNAATGAISGMPTKLGVFNFTTQATDASSPAKTVTRTFSITINSLTANPPAPPMGLRVVPSP